ncbi:MAG: hypothetical protein HUU21_10045 [Polyangiaceae bacterium]|nr:hypothetical protein [Polyangiaceae bacterium]
MKIGFGVAILTSVLAIYGCGGHETEGDHSSHTSSSSGAAGSGGAGGGEGGAGGGGGGSTADPEPPIMTSVSPLAGVLHVEWDNVTPDCTAIELDRNKDGGAYALEYTLTGAATSQHDSEATPPGMYCYKARCKKGDKISVDSNEKCGTP